MGNTTRKQQREQNTNTIRKINENKHENKQEIKKDNARKQKREQKRNKQMLNRREQQ